MKVLLQRVSRARVTVKGRTVGEIGMGLLVLLGIESGDDPAAVDWNVDKTADLRIFSDDKDQMNLGLTDVGGSVLLVSQFTLAGTTARGRRPSFARAARPAEAEPLCVRFADRLRARGIEVATGEFGAMMQVELVNDGPVTLMLDPAPSLRVAT